MTYQQPAFMVSHPSAGLVIGDITLSGPATITDAEKRMLIDARVSDFAIYGSAGSNAHLDFDFGAAQSLDRVVIPAGHNLDTLDLTVRSDTQASFATSTLEDSWTQSGSGVIDRTWDSASLQYWRFSILDSAGSDHQVSEVWYGERKQLAAAITPDFETPYVYQQNDVEYPGGIATVQLAIPRRVFSLTIRNLDPASTDYTTLDEVINLGRANPFWYWPTDSLDGGPYLVKLSRDGKREQDSSVPNVRVRYRVDIEMEEVSL